MKYMILQASTHTSALTHTKQFLFYPTLHGGKTFVINKIITFVYLIDIISVLVTTETRGA